MKIRNFLVILFLLLFAPLVSSNAYAVEYIDFGDAEVFEEALNNGENVVNKIVSFEVVEIHPNSSFGFNLWAGQHLNFVSTTPFDVSPRDILTVRVTNVSSMFGSWMITYEIINDAIPGPETRYYNAEANLIKPLQIIECGFSCSERNTRYDTYYSFILYNPNDNKTISFPTVRMVARDANGTMLGTREQGLYQIDPRETVAFASSFPNLDVVPATIDFQVVEPQDYNIITSTKVITDPMRAVNYTMKDTGFGTNIVGEISNYTGYDFSMVGVVILFRDANGNLAGGETQYVNNVMSGQTTPFELSIHSALTVFDKYEVRVIPWSEAQVSKSSSSQSTQVTAATPAMATAAATPAIASASAAAVPTTTQPASSADSNLVGNSAPDQAEYSFGKGKFYAGQDFQPGTYDILCLKADDSSYSDSMSTFSDVYSGYGMNDYANLFDSLGGMYESLSGMTITIYDANGGWNNYYTVKEGESARIVLTDGMSIDIDGGSAKLTLIR